MCEAKTADGVKITPGMEIWVTHSIMGLPPTKYTVDWIDPKGTKVYYKNPHPDDYEGAKTTVCWYNPKKAMIHALFGEKYDNRLYPVVQRLKKAFDYRDGCPWENAEVYQEGPRSPSVRYQYVVDCETIAEYVANMASECEI